MRVYFTRDSVCAGDDGDAPHAREIDVPDGVDAEALVRAILADQRLPSISGGKATWAASSGIPLAVIAQEWNDPKMLSPFPTPVKKLDVIAGVLRLHFSYFAQQDPHTVFEVLQQLRLTAE